MPPSEGTNCSALVPHQDDSPRPVPRHERSRARPAPACRNLGPENPPAEGIRDCSPSAKIVDQLMCSTCQFAFEILGFNNPREVGGRPVF